MTYMYKDHEIYARVYQSMSTLYEVNRNGAMTSEVEGCEIIHDDQEIVFYEVECIEPKTGLYTRQLYKTFDEAKDAVKASAEWVKLYERAYK